MDPTRELEVGEPGVAKPSPQSIVFEDGLVIRGGVCTSIDAHPAWVADTGARVANAHDVVDIINGVMDGAAMSLSPRIGWEVLVIDLDLPGGVLGCRRESNPPDYAFIGQHSRLNLVLCGPHA